MIRSRWQSLTHPASVGQFRGGAFGRPVGFTLIELLIVVAIIAILAAIAVPNFLEAQTRSKVSRTKSDLRSLATAVETYRVDNNAYPPAELYDSLQGRLRGFTTPIAYISTIFTDPFWVRRPSNFGGLEPYYAYCPGNIYFGDENVNAQYRNAIYSLGARGPDTTFNFGGYCMSHPTAVFNRSYEFGSYDPTNGTVSAGDIIRLGSNTLGGFEP